MKRVLKWIIITMCLLFLVLPISAQTSGTVYSVFPNAKYPLQSFTATGSGCLTLNGLSAGSLRVAGTFTNFTVTFGLANDSNSTCATGNFTNANVLPMAGGPATSSVSSAGLYLVNLAAMSQLKITATCSSCTGTITIQMMASAAQATEIPIRPPDADPCQDPEVQKQSAAITGTAPSTVVAITNTAGKTTFVCDINVVTGTSATSVQIKAGTGATCGTGTVNLTGAVPIAVGQQFFGGWGGTVFGSPQVPASNDICVTVAGGTAGFAGWATFVQQ